MARAKKVQIEPIRLLVDEHGERFFYTFRGTWLVGLAEIGSAGPGEDGLDHKEWSIARSEKGKFVAYCRDIAPDAAGVVTVAASHQELATQVPRCIFEELEVALGVRRVHEFPERPLDV